MANTEFCVIGFSRKRTAAISDLKRQFGRRFEFHTFDLNNVKDISSFVNKISVGKDIFGLINNAAMPTRSVLATMHELEILANCERKCCFVFIDIKIRGKENAEKQCRKNRQY